MFNQGYVNIIILISYLLINMHKHAVYVGSVIYIYMYKKGYLIIIVTCM